MRKNLLRPPACALTQLCVYEAYICDKDFLFLTASSITLPQVTLERIEGLSDRGFLSFLNTIRDTVDKMRCLQALRIRGASASELVLRRRFDVFVKCGRSSGLPVVQLSLHFVPKHGRYKQ